MAGRGLASEPASWAEIAAYAIDQAGEAAAGRGPKRNESVEARYSRYARWCAERGHTGVELLLATSMWREADARALVALEPNIVPYYCETGVEHWILWYHPERTPGGMDLDIQRATDRVRAFIPSLSEDERVIFQNLPQFRSVCEIAHAHAFLRPRSQATTARLSELRAERRLRSPWAEAERLGGRGDEAGWSTTVPDLAA